MFEKRTDMKWILMLAMTLMTGFATYAQTADTEEEEVFRIVEEMPVYPGGEDGLKDFLSGFEPPQLKNMEKFGTAYVRFKVGPDGFCKDFEIARSSGNKKIDEAALEYAAKMEQWQPGKQQGKPVTVAFIIPLRLKS